MISPPPEHEPSSNRPADDPDRLESVGYVERDRQDDPPEHDHQADGVDDRTAR